MKRYPASIAGSTLETVHVRTSRRVSRSPSSNLPTQQTLAATDSPQVGSSRAERANVPCAPGGVAARWTTRALLVAALAALFGSHPPAFASHPQAAASIPQATDASEDAGQKAPGQEPQQRIANFGLLDTMNERRTLDDLRDSQLVAVVFTGCECPIARAYARRLEELAAAWPRKSVAWLMINSNHQDSAEEQQRWARELQLTIPLLHDDRQEVAGQFTAERTPEVFLLDADRVVRYRGRIDDQHTYGRQRPAPTTHDLRDAIESLLAGRSVAVARTEAPGCLIGRVPAGTAVSTTTPTWSGAIARLFHRRCVSCHREGEAAPFALTDYHEVAGWAGMIREVVNQRRMPPWHASPEFGKFRNDCRLGEDEIRLINQWVEGGVPQGDPAELPATPEFAVGWQIGEPDQVVPMAKRAFPVPAKGTLDYQYFEADPGFTEDKWICAAECRAGQRGVVHHIIVGIAGEGDFGEGVHDRVQSDWIAAAAPGSPPMVLPAGYAKRVPAGAKLIFQMHYTPNGTAVEDLSSIGLKFADPATLTHQVVTLKAMNDRFEIPPRTGDHPVKARFRFSQAAELISLFPHMHLRGKAFRYTAVFPGGEREVLLDIPRYDFNWQNGYELDQPRLIPAGTRFECEARFDNSADNIANPDPDQTVRWGDQTWEEMMIGYFNAAIPIER